MVIFFRQNSVIFQKTQIFGNLIVSSITLIRTTEPKDVLDLHKNVGYVSWSILQLLK